MNPFRRVYCHTKVSDSTGKQAREDIYYDPANPTQLYTAVPVSFHLSLSLLLTRLLLI
jgi:hypothetical protein